MAGAVEGSEPARPRLGINLAGVADWNTELPFVDVFRMSRVWVSQQAGQPWGKGPPLTLDQHGWVTRLESNCWAETPLCNVEPGHYPSGEYTVLYEGRGKIDFWGRAVQSVSNSPGRIVVHIDAKHGPFHLRLRATDPADYIRNIRVIMPGFEETYRSNPWHPDFLGRWQGVACIRFMDWQQTNDSPLGRWADRPTKADATFSQKGVALEWMIDLCNRLRCDSWFCLPHAADDDFIREFARLVARNLDPSLRVFVEYSNEVWNRQFGQSKHALSRGTALQLATEPTVAGRRWYARRSREIFRIFETEFGGRDRLVRVLATQAAFAGVTRDILEFEGAARHADALAIAPYMGFSVAPVDARGRLTTSDVENWTVEQVLDQVERASLPEAIERIREQKRLAAQHGLRLIAYEGGQHLVGSRGGENNSKVTALFLAANAHPRMGDIYRRYLDAWTTTGGDLFCHYSSVGRWTKWGSWGLLQHYDDDPAQSPKLRAVREWAERHR